MKGTPKTKDSKHKCSWANGDNRLLDNFASEQPDTLVGLFVSDHGTLLGYPLVSGHSRSFIGLKSSTASTKGTLLAALTLETL